MKLTLRSLRSASVHWSLADLTHTATSLSELIHSGPSAAYMGKSCSVSFKNLNKVGNTWHVTYLVFGSNDYSNQNGWPVHIRFYPEAHVENPLDLDVDVSCDCPAFLYYGAQYRVHEKDALERPQPGGLLQPANLADYPKHTYLICKHIKAVSERISGLLQKHLKKHTEDSDYDEKRTKEIAERVKAKEQIRLQRNAPIAPVPAQIDHETI